MLPPQPNVQIYSPNNIFSIYSFTSLVFSLAKLKETKEKAGSTMRQWMKNLSGQDYIIQVPIFFFVFFQWKKISIKMLKQHTFKI